MAQHSENFEKHKPPVEAVNTPHAAHAEAHPATNAAFNAAKATRGEETNKHIPEGSVSEKYLSFGAKAHEGQAAAPEAKKHTKELTPKGNKSGSSDSGAEYQDVDPAAIFGP